MSTANIPPVPASVYEEGLFVQELTPIGGSLVGSFFVGLIPLLTVLFMLGGLKTPAHYASAVGLIVWYVDKQGYDGKKGGIMNSL